MKINCCSICPRNCKIDRTNAVGFCGANNKVKIAKVMLHYYEEPIISGDNTTQKTGSGAIFFSHCSLKCKYCQNYEISSGGHGKEIEISSLADIFKQLENSGATNINLVSPSHYSLQIIEAFKLYRPNIPIIWNTSGYETLETLKLLDGYVDIYLTDFKYLDKHLAQEFSLAKDYPDVIVNAITEMKRQQPSDIIKNGLMQKGVIIRHMILPDCTSDSLNIIKTINDNFGNNTILSIMSQYTPTPAVASHPILSKRIKPVEYKICINCLNKYNFKNVFVQDLSSASKDYTPDFNIQEKKFKY